MIQTKLKISQSQKGLGGDIILFGFIEVVLIFVTLSDKSGADFWGIVFSVGFFVICFSVILASLLFKVEVIDSTISVRTRIGRCYTFTISEITKIVCDIYNDKEYGDAGIISIETATRKFEIRQTMNGFQEMAGYILEKLESGEINEAAVSVYCKRKLSKYKTTKLTKPKIKR